ncbi:MAG TPA: glycosyl hydrolase 108 family protein [Burkholderiaceae bacterium]|nr:glycosyl hydrolase 108 family protein [Burkholderiaceae bacterium]
MDFDQAFARTIGHEGGYAADSRDPGGETNYGISRRAYPGEDIAGMTLDRAAQIYRRDYWDAIHAEQMPEAIRRELFDTAVNMGTYSAVTLLQRALGVTAAGPVEG